MRLQGRAVIVTGPAKGMGRAITLCLAGHGADLVLAGRDLAAIRPVAAEVEALGRRALVVPTDITKEAEVAAMVAQAAAFGPGIDGLVNVAGAAGPGARLLWEHAEAEVRDLLAVNVLGPFLLMKHVLIRMIDQGRGRIVHVGGTFGHKAARRHAAYGATKWALRGLVRTAALEAGPYGITVNTVAPGGVEGPRLARQLTEAAARQGIGYDEAHARVRAAAAQNRFSEAGDIANAVAFLLSDEARMITGQDLVVDGGTLL